MKTENQDKIVNKIKKLLSITEKSNASQNEIEQAILLAQRLMQKYNIDFDVININNEEEVISDKLNYEDYKGYIWAKELARIIANNYCCKIYLTGGVITFYGYKEHIQISKEVFKTLFKFGNEKALKYCRDYAKQYGHSRGVYNSFCLGFVTGIKSILEEQCKALQVVVPPKVEVAFNNLNLIKGKSIRLNTNVDDDRKIFNTGYATGREALTRKGITDKNG